MPGSRTTPFRLALLGAGLLACATPSHREIPADTAAPPVHLRIFATTDLHGWLAPEYGDDGRTIEGGLVYLGGCLRTREGFRPDQDLLIDVGDMWTGPAESTLAKGRPLVAAMNHLGYAAAVVGNHEFDFGLDTLRRRSSEAHFPFLAANLSRADGAPLEFATPYHLVTIQGVRIGIIGLTYDRLSQLTNPDDRRGLTTSTLVPAVRRWSAELRRQGARFIIVAHHGPMETVAALAHQVEDLGIHLFLSGHSHRADVASLPGEPGPADDLLLVNPGAHAASYARIDLTLSPDGQLLDYQAVIVPVAGTVAEPACPPDAELSALLEEAQDEVAALAERVLGHATGDLRVGTFDSSPLGHLLTDAWLAAIPEADFALSNLGGLRQELAAGPITIADLVGVLPFENSLYVVELTGEQLRQELENGSPVVGGLRYTWRATGGSGRQVVAIYDRDGATVQPGQRYRVVITDYLYGGGDGFRFAQDDPTPRATTINWREPLYRYIQALTDRGLPVRAPREARATELLR